MGGRALASETVSLSSASWRSLIILTKHPGAETIMQHLATLSAGSSSLSPPGLLLLLSLGLQGEGEEMALWTLIFSLFWNE